MDEQEARRADPASVLLTLRGPRGTAEIFHRKSLGPAASAGGYWVRCGETAREASSLAEAYVTAGGLVGAIT